MREQLAEMLTLDDTAAALLRGARPRNAVDESGEIAVAGTEGADPTRIKAVG